MKLNKYIKLFEDFKNKSIPEIIKKISYTIRKDLIINGNNSFKKNYNIDSINVNIIVNFKKSNKKPYYSNINIYDIIKGIEPIDIKIIVEDNKIDINYLMSIISHEIRHIYDIYTVSDDIEMEEFVKSIPINKYKNNFINLVYLSLEHELIARHNMLYELYRWINITDKSKLYEIFKTSYVYKSLIDLNNFNHLDFINNEKDILKFTNNFSNDIKDNFDGDLIKYYQKWEYFFKEKSKEFLSYIDSMLDDIIEDVKNNKIYERQCGFISYNEDINNKISEKIFYKIIVEKNLFQNPF